MANEFMGWQQYLHVRKEDTWGTKAGGNPDIFIPYTECSIKTIVQSRQSEAYCGVRQQRDNQVVNATISGNLNMPAYGYQVSSKSILQYFLDAVLSGPASPNIDSFTIEKYEAGVDNKRWLGARPNSFTLAGDATSGIITTTCGMICKEEVGGITAPTLSPTNPQPIAFTFDEVDFWLSSDSEASQATGSGERVEIRSFNLTVANNLQTYHVDSFYPGLVPAGVRSVNFEFGLFKNADTYDVLRRTSGTTNRAARLKLRGRHLGTGSGTYSVLEVWIDKLNFMDADETGGRNDIVSQNVKWLAIKPNTTDSECELKWGTE